MSESPRILDARGLPCPQPVILTRNALAEGGFDLLEVIVDNAASRENVTRFATYAKCGIEGVREEGNDHRILIRPSHSGVELPYAEETCPGTTSEPMKTGDGNAETLLVSANTIGKGDADLGALLMRGFLYTLTESVNLPHRIIFMNSGVHLVVEGSESLVNLRRLVDRRVEILACGTCLEFYKLKESLAVGRVSNMYEIAEFLLQGKTLSL